MNNLRIGTHSGTFHCDEVTGCMFLQNYTAKFKGCDIVRSRDPAVLSELDIVIDVGGEYDHDRHRYDHHQHGFAEVYNEKANIKLSAAGLVYKHFGPEIIENALNELFDSGKITNSALRALVTPKAIEKLTLNMYENFLVTIDAIDNGIDRYPKETKPRYNFYHTHLAARVSRLNPSFWDEGPPSFDAKFVVAMQLSREEFLAELLVSFMSSFASTPIVREAWAERMNHCESGQVLILKKSCFWKEALFEIEKEEKSEGTVKFVLYVDSASGEWRVQAVPKNLGTFDNRGALKEEWRGLTAVEIQKLSGLEDAVFCHHSGFIGGCKSFESSLKMAKMSLEALAK